MRFSYNTALSNHTLNNGYGVAGWYIINSLKKLGHEVYYDTDKADAEITFAQPEYFTKRNNQYQILYTPWESTKLKPFWADTFNSADATWTTSDWVAGIYEKEGVDNLTTVYPHGICKEWSPRKKNRKGPIKFLHCLSEDTDILTERGWLGVDEILENDLVATLNQSSGKMEYLPINFMVGYEVDEKLIHIQNKGTDILVTKSHDLLIKNQGTVGGFNKVKAKEVLKFSGLTTKKYIPLIPKVSNIHVDKIYLDQIIDRSDYHGHSRRDFEYFNAGDLFELIGWYISEGSHYKGKSCWFTRIAQRKIEGRQRIESLLDRMSIKYYYSDHSGEYIISRRDIYDIMSQFGKGCENKTIARWCFSHSTENLNRMLESLLLGDGSRMRCYYTTSKQLSEDVQELCTLLGRRTTVSSRIRDNTNRKPLACGRIIYSRKRCYQVNIWQDKRENSVGFSFLQDNIREVDYRGKVWCINNDNGTIIIRRNSKISVVGNCGGPSSRKGWQEALDAFREAFGDDPKRATLTIKAYQRNLARWYDSAGRVRNPNDLPNVKVITKEMTQSELREFTQGFDCLVYPSYSEGMGLIPMQSLAQGTPTICTGEWAHYSNYLGDLYLDSSMIDSPWGNEHPGQVCKPNKEHLIELMLKVESDFENLSKQFFAQSFDFHKEYDWVSLTKKAFDPIVKSLST